MPRSVRGIVPELPTVSLLRILFASLAPHTGAIAFSGSGFAGRSPAMTTAQTQRYCEINRPHVHFRSLPFSIVSRTRRPTSSLHCMSA
jgi:hypothetical protein